MSKFELKIEKTWDDQVIQHEAVKISLEQDSTDSEYLNVKIEAPFFNSPKKPDTPIGEFFNLWDYEVVEVFFLANESGKYLELEFGPHGHYVVLLIQAPGKKVIREGLKIDYKACINANHWIGEAKIHKSLLPSHVNRLNAYSIHGESSDRKYEALYPVPYQKYAHADFHRLDYFQSFEMSRVFPTYSDESSKESDIWKN